MLTLTTLGRVILLIGSLSLAITSFLGPLALHGSPRTRLQSHILVLRPSFVPLPLLLQRLSGYVCCWLILMFLMVLYVSPVWQHWSHSDSQVSRESWASQVYWCWCLNSHAHIARATPFSFSVFFHNFRWQIYSVRHRPASIIVFIYSNSLFQTHPCNRVTSLLYMASSRDPCSPCTGVYITHHNQYKG